MTTPRDRIDADVVVVGSGLGAVAATLAAARAGRRVALVAGRGRLGGQATTQLVPALDEHPYVETGGVSRSYRTFRALVRARYGGLANPGGGWVSRLCFEPYAAEEALEDMLAAHVAEGRLTVLRGLSPTAVHLSDERVDAITFVPTGSRETAADVVPRRRSDNPDDLTARVRAIVVTGRVFCDATEAGDLLPLADVPWVCGSEGQDAFGESLALPGPEQPDAVQSCTVGFLVQRLPDDVPPPAPGAAPEGYERWRDAQPFTLDIAGWDDRAHRYRMFENGPDGHLPFWTYRRLRDAAAVGGTDVALINWAGNDYADRSALADPEHAYAEAKRLSAAFLHWLRTECPRDDGGTGYPEFVLAPQIAGTADGYAEEPYLRESRRLRTPQPVRQQDLEPVPGHARARAFTDSGGIALYHMDLHSRVGHPRSAYAPTAPFQVPLSALVAPRPGNLLAAAKNLGATQVAAAAYRVHHGEWAVGEAAGALAAQSCERNIAPAAVVAERAELTLLQARLAHHGVPLAWALDVPDDHADFVGVQLLGAAGALDGDRAHDLDVRPDEQATEESVRPLRAAAEHLAGGPLPALPARLTWAQSATALWHHVARTLPGAPCAAPSAAAPAVNA
ncbi:FAD-dependent oxidoreductase [Streptomyces sp. VRA16 Mangrove soil]|uniref:FAD-dependent oxidoreductase n=1 Tax=Streptomyces sp. VRA16 Mangrove soil TaxID=2817434 RepID=UPI001A9D6137|nr:FAD-dependent oxidoreductase [Streptomyces sp. VRA16 Mangrove soil]MBO1332304.1 FAD-dependent oxidoreductase [Streptomyces sp. VRA16 Mangrove soil]